MPILPKGPRTPARLGVPGEQLVMNNNSREDLYDGLLILCQDYGFTTEHTHDLLNAVIDSILDSEPEEEIPYTGKCLGCDEGEPRVPSSVKPGVFVHTRTSLGRRVCTRTDD
jgi:hypothetical protein